MKEKLELLRRLRERREAVYHSPQTVEREYTATRLDLEIRAIDAEVELALAKRALTLLDAFFKTGQGCAIREDGARIEMHPVVTSNSIHNFWNVRAEAFRVAAWSLGL